ILPAESKVKVIDSLVNVTDSSVTNYDSVDESSVCSTPLPLLEKLAGFTINEPTSAPAKGNKNVSASKMNSAPTGSYRAPNVVEPELRTIVEIAPMVTNQTMEELFQAPMEGYVEAIVIPKVNADHFEIRTNLLQLVQANWQRILKKRTKSKPKPNKIKSKWKA
nr:reverse transcriptase domain-containing protein [Tanacetum cinerariifolium]